MAPKPEVVWNLFAIWCSSYLLHLNFLANMKVDQKVSL